MITTIIFDIGGVFFHQPDELTHRVWRKYGCEDGAYGNQLMYGDLWEVYKRGGMSEEKYWKQVSSGVSSVSTTFWGEIRDGFERAVVLDRNLVEVVRKLKETYRIHALSNAGAELERRLYQFKINDLFEVVVNSHYAKLAKPDEEIFRHTAQLIQAEPREILFVDDKIRNTTIAEKLGFHVHVYTTTKNFVSAMERIKQVVPKS
jgi:FMN phosphatase YigB (HAD superfamily)